MKIGYLRVSLEDQKEDRQADGLKDLCDEIYVEKVSGASKKRPVYQQVIEKLKAGDTLVVWDLDRAFRSTVDALLEAEKLRQREAAFAQFERQNLIKRTKEGMASARKRGKHIGRPYKLNLEEVLLAHSRIQAGRINAYGHGRAIRVFNGDTFSIHQAVCGQ